MPTPTGTTGLIENNTASPATLLEIAISNDNLATALTIEIEVFVVFTTFSPKVPIAHQLFSIAPLTANIRTFNITGALAYEVQADVTGAANPFVPNLVLNVFSKDANNNLIASQRVLDSEMVGTVLTPVP